MYFIIYKYQAAGICIFAHRAHGTRAHNCQVHATEYGYFMNVTHARLRCGAGRITGVMLTGISGWRVAHTDSWFTLAHFFSFFFFVRLDTVFVVVMRILQMKYMAQPISVINYPVSGSALAQRIYANASQIARGPEWWEPHLPQWWMMMLMMMPICSACVA